MSRVLHFVSFILVIGATLLLGTLASADELDDFREAWQARLEEQKTAVYRAVGVRSLAADGDPRGTAKADFVIDAALDCERRKFRFDCYADGKPARVLILDGGRFHTCTPRGVGWEVASATAIAPESPWWFAYPLLLAHGAVPAPPFEAPRLGRARAGEESQDRSSVGSREATFSFDGDHPTAVTVAHSLEGLVSRFLVTRGDRKAVEIRNTYRRDGESIRLDRFTVFVFAPDGAVAATLEGRVERFNVDVPISPKLFAKPRSSKELAEQVAGLLEKPVRVELQMTAEELANAIGRAVGEDLPIHVDQEAIERAPNIRTDRFTFDPGEAPLADVLLTDLPANRLDFCFDLQGITVIPRAAAWGRADFVEYAAAEQGVSLDELRDALYRGAARIDDWSDVGGPARMVIDEQQGVISVYHAQSDHFRMQRRLDELQAAEE